jgi:hypothetical protein
VILQPSAIARGRDTFAERMGDPSTWTGDWRKCPEGNYLKGEEQKKVGAALAKHERMMVGMALRQIPSGTIGSFIGVSRETIGKRLRGFGLNTKRGRPVTAAKS